MDAEEACRIVDGWGPADVPPKLHYEACTAARTLRRALAEAQDSVHELRGELYAVGYERDALRCKLDAAMKVAASARQLADTMRGCRPSINACIVSDGACRDLLAALAALESDPT